MKSRIIIFLPLLFSFLISIAQNPINVQARQSGANIIITYNISNTTPEMLFDIALFCKIGEADSFELKSVTGDVGAEVKGGKQQYKIVWDVFSELDEFSTADFFVNATLINAESFYSSIDSAEFVKQIEEDKLIQQAKLDARANYRNTGILWGTGCATLAYGLPGLIVAIVATFSEPDDRRLNMPDTEYAKNKLYKEEYMKEAMRVKRKRVWVTFGATALPMAILIISASINTM